MGSWRGYKSQIPRGYIKSLEATFTTTASFNAYTASHEHGGGGGPGGGIFTEVNGTQAFTTSSVNIGTNDTPTQTLNVRGVTELSGGLVHKRQPKTADYTVTTSDYFIAADSSGGAITFSLPNAASATEGQTWVFKDEGGAAHTNNIIISPSQGGQTIDGLASIRLESPYASVQIYTDGVSKYYVF